MNSRFQRTPITTFICYYQHMTGDKQPAGKPPVGSHGNPPKLPGPTKDGFYRGLDNKIYHDKPDIYIRLAQLKHEARLGATASAWLLVLPLAVFAAAGLSYATTRLLPEYDAQALLNPPILLLLFLSLLAAVGFPLNAGILAIINSRAKAFYSHTSWYLYNTDLAVLVANEQFSLRIIEETKDMPILKWTGAPPPTSFEDYIRFSACYRNAICKCFSGKQLINSKSLVASSIPLASLRHGSCLHFLGTGNAKALGRIGSCFSVFGCGFTGLLAIPMLVVGVLRDAERRGSLAAICDFFIGTCELDVDNLKLPPERRPKRATPRQQETPAE